MLPKPVNLGIKDVQHIGIPVTDIARSESFYTNLGFKNVMQANFIHNHGQGTCIMMKQGNIVIELYQIPDAELKEIAVRKDGHVDHVAFDVRDIDKTFSVLKAAGYQIIEDAPVQLAFWKNGCRYFNILGPDGERLEFNEIL